MGNQTNYQDLIKKVEMYLDNSLGKDEERQLLKDIQSNPACLEVLKKEKSFREFIKSRLYRRPVSPALVESIKEKIRINAPNAANGFKI